MYTIRGRRPSPKGQGHWKVIMTTRDYATAHRCAHRWLKGLGTGEVRRTASKSLPLIRYDLGDRKAPAVLVRWETVPRTHDELWKIFIGYRAKEKGDKRDD